MSEDFLNARRTLILGGEINSEQIERIGTRMTEFQCESEEPIKLIINSGGGSISSALLLCDVIEHFLTAPVHGYVVGECSSAATFILLHCAERKCTQYSTFVIHSATFFGIEIKVDKTTTNNLESLLEETRATQEMLIKMYMKKLNLEREKVEALLTRGDQTFNNALSAQEAREIGLVKEIIEGKLDLLAH